jgi:hypothetical protein
VARFYIAVDQPNPSRLVGALRPGFHPSFDERARLLLRARRGLASKSWRPGPTDQMIFADMLDERIERTVSVTRRILDLGANLAERLALPCHFTRGEVPDRVAGYTGGLEVRLLVADRTTHGWQAMTVRTALDRWLVEPGHVALARTVTGGMAVQTTRVRKHLAKFREYRRRPGRRIAYRGEALGRREAGRWLGNGVRRRGAGQQGYERNEDLDPHLFTPSNIASHRGRRPITTLLARELR